MKWLLGVRNSGVCASLALLVLRLVTGVAFVLHGWPKIQSPMNWMGPEAPVPGILQLVAAVSEFGGGILLIAGLLTPIAAIFVGATMVVAIQFHVQRGDGFVGGYELAVVYLMAMVAILLQGPGLFSVDAAIFGRRGSTSA